MVYQSKNPIGYKQLLTWRQAGEILRQVKEIVKRYLSRYEDKRLVNHLTDSARSVQRNIEEGYKRATTKEYIEFLGFSRGSLEELKGDFEELKREIREGIREDKGGGMLKNAEGLLNLIYGEDCMFGRQIKSLEEKMVKEKTLPKSGMVKRVWSGIITKGNLKESRNGIMKRENFGPNPSMLMTRRTD